MGGVLDLLLPPWPRAPQTPAWGCPGRGDLASIKPPSQHPPGPFGASSHLVVCCFWWGHSRLRVALAVMSASYSHGAPGLGAGGVSASPARSPPRASLWVLWPQRAGGVRLSPVLEQPQLSQRLPGLWALWARRSSGASARSGTLFPVPKSPVPAGDLPLHRSVSVSSIISYVLALHCPLCLSEASSRPPVPYMDLPTALYSPVPLGRSFVCFGGYA